MNQSQKNKILLVTGVADTFFSERSHRKLPYGIELASKISTLVEQNKESYSGYINLLVPGDSNRFVAPLDGIRKQRVLNVQLNSNSLFDISNELALTEEDNTTLLLNGNDLDFVLRPEEYEIHICGVDINGVYKGFIDELLNLKYTVYLYSDLIKRFKNTEDSIKNIRNRNFKYCSSRFAV